MIRFAGHFSPPFFYRPSNKNHPKTLPLFALLHFTPIFTVKAVKMNIPQLGEMILFHRKRAGLSREACALLAGVGKTAVYDLEHGKETIRLDTLLKVIKALNINLQFGSPLMEEFNHREKQIA